MLITAIEKQTYDYAIVGAGPAGISLALRLTEKAPQSQILLIESGGKEHNSDISRLSEVEATGDLPAAYYPVHAQRVLGGTSSVWSGFCTMMESRAFDKGLWPVKFDELLPFYKEAADVLELPAASYQTPYKEIAENSNILYRPYYLSSPVRFNDKYSDILVDHKSIDLLLAHTVTTIESDADKITTIHVQDSTGKDKTKTPVNAKNYILACGGIGNPKLMLQNQLAEGSPVGNYFSEHPHIYQAGKVELDKQLIDKVVSKDKVYHALQLSDEYCKKHDLLNFSVSFTMDDTEDRPFMGAIKKTYVGDMTIRSEMENQITNKVGLGSDSDQLDQPTTTLDFNFNYQALGKKTWDIVAKSLVSSGIGRATKAPEQYPAITGGGHYVGTTRMGNSANDSVVDGNCKVHQYDNLYVAGSSVFATSGAANPTFTIVAFALRLADHLSTQSKG